MDIDKPVNKCLECGKPVEVSWWLYCRICYLRLTRAGQGEKPAVKNS